jgi:hypothetical protein
MRLSNLIRQFVIWSEQVAHNLAVISQGAIGQAERKRLERETIKELKRIEKVGLHSMLDHDERQRITRALDRYKRRLRHIDHKNQHKILAALNRSEKGIITRVCSLIYDCSPNKFAAKQLIDRVLAKL